MIDFFFFFSIVSQQLRYCSGLPLRREVPVPDRGRVEAFPLILPPLAVELNNPPDCTIFSIRIRSKFCCASNSAFTF